MSRGLDRVRTALRQVRIRIEHDVYGRRAERLHASHFDDVRRFCLFIGYPRSGHSLVGAMLNAHPRVVIAHEANLPDLIDQSFDRDALFARLLARAELFHRRGNTSNYSYEIPGQWQGRFTSLDVLGEKRGGAVTRRLGREPDFLNQVRERVRVPLRLVHVVRHPLDNITAISLANHLSLDESIDYYFLHCGTTARLDEWCEPGELLTLHHEDFFRGTAAQLRRLCDHVGVEPEPDYVRDCASIVFPSPTHTRRKGAWSAEQVARVEERAAACPFLQRYTYELEA